MQGLMPNFIVNDIWERFKNTYESLNLRVLKFYI